MSNRLPRRRVLEIGASCAGALALHTLLRPVVAAAQDAAPAPTSSPATRPSEHMLIIARRDVSPAGQRQRALVANETFPSFALEAREGELVAVTVENAHDAPTAIHFHGVVVPNAMDGVANLTQPPIEPGKSFVYEFPLREAGTYFYESTWGTQRQIGLAGAFVIQPREPRHRVEHDEVLLLSDWTTADPAHVVHHLRMGHKEDEASGEPARLVNPLPDGKPFPIDVRYNAYLLNGRSHRDAWTKEVKSGQRMRLRIVNASAATFFRFQVEGHSLQVIAADGRDVEPVEVDDLVVATGERYDVLLTVGEAGSHTVRAAALGAPGGAVGVLYTPGVRPVVGTRPPRWGKRTLRYEQLRAVADTTFPGGGKPQRVQLTLGGDEKSYSWNVDGVPGPGEFVKPPASPAAPLALPSNARVVLEVANRTSLWQAVHLHGYRFRLLGAAGARAPWKDTVAVAPQASVELEVLTDQPGRWLFTGTHLYRAQSGLSRVLSVD